MAESTREFLETALADNNKIVTKLSGLPEAGLALLAMAASLRTQRPLAIVTASAEHAVELFDNLEYFGHPSVRHFPKWEILPYETEEPVVEILAKSLETYELLLDFSPSTAEPPPLTAAGEFDFKKLEKRTEAAPIIVTSFEACLQRVFPQSVFEQFCLKLEWGERIELEELAQRLVDAGYEREAMVEGRAEFSIRGGVIDIFPVNFEHPVRLDLFGDELESIRWFDLSTQRSFKKMEIPEVVRVPPAAINRLLTQQAAAGESMELLPDLLPENALLLLDDADAFPELAEKFQALVEGQYQEAVKEPDADDAPDDAAAVPAPQSLFASFDELDAAFSTVSTTNQPRQLAVHSRLPVSRGDKSIRFTASSFADIKPSLDTYISLITAKQREDYLTVIVCDNDGQVMRLDEMLGERELGAVQLLAEERFAKEVQRRDPLTGYSDVMLCTGALHNGLIWPEAHLLLVTDREMFGRYRRRQVYRKIYQGAPVRTAADLGRGDCIVHADHGIGRFLGLRRQQLDGRQQELLELEYAEGNKLLVPLEKIGLVQKYTVVEGAARPPLDKLGSNKWLKRKQKSQEDIEKMARELLELYARREAARGLTYGPDTVWGQEFEASFIHQETPDQLEAVRAVKEDMASEKPMDRLICGDVGYGKTEVAIRAAFKAIQEQRQVLVLCPTTILAQQHWQTFRERFAEYPISVEMLSRFRTPKQQKEILKNLRDGELDLLVGTHRLLSKDVEAHRLGLLIVDEEQRFGVRHKERIKQLRATVDVITLTATPIPRTLYMSLSGLRDMSLIQTPPANRLPIRTRIIHFEEETIKEAILRELNRDGQIFFVHNRVHNIEQVAQRLREIAPQARVAIAHGQMDNRTLEKVMLEFIDGQHDLLLSTTIIENGLDIPNVNTIIINRADAFGLAQLYQLRGRVGRAVRRAYAYLIVPEGQAITDTAARRLAAIEEFTELGHGFDIAMRDMEIRGAGNILGSQQHGVMLQVGFDLYCEMLQQAVKKLKGEELPEEERTVEVVWKCDAFVPDSYTPVETQRVAIYKKLAALHSVRAVEDLAEELRDRYGQPPKPVRRLLDIARLRILAVKGGLRRLQATPKGLKLFSTDDPKDLLPFIGAAKKQGADITSFSHDDDDCITIDVVEEGSEEKMAAAIRLLSFMVDAIKQD